MFSSNIKQDIQFLQVVGNKAKRRISKRVFQENKARQIFRKTNISYSLIRTRAYQGVRNVRFSENLACFVFLKYPFWDSPFCLITDEVCNMKPTCECSLKRLCTNQPLELLYVLLKTAKNKGVKTSILSWQPLKRFKQLTFYLTRCS